MALVFQRKTPEDGRPLEISIEGSLDADANFVEAFPDLPPQVDFYLRKLERINSAGVSKWIGGMTEAVVKKGIQGRLLECSLAFVEQCNIIKNFSLGMPLVSIMLPYYCSKCDKSFEVLEQVENLRAQNFEPPTVNCVHCNEAGAEFDDDPVDYFHFAKK